VALDEDAELRRLREELVSKVSHDLRSPITAIAGFVEVLLAREDGPLNETQVQYLEIVASNTDRLLQVVDRLIDEAAAGGASSPARYNQRL